MKAAFHLSPSLILTLLYPHLTSNFENNADPFTRLMSSGIRGSGYRLRIVHSLTYPVILHWAELPIFLFDEEEGGGVGTLRRADVSLLKMFCQELLQCFLFYLSEGVDLPWDCGGDVFL